MSLSLVRLGPVGAKKETKDEVVTEAAIWGIFGVLALARLRYGDAGVAAFACRWRAKLAQGRWDGQDCRADKHGSAEVRGGVRVARNGRQWG